MRWCGVWGCWRKAGRRGGSTHSQRSAFGPPFVPEALVPENHSATGALALTQGPLKVNLSRRRGVEVAMGG